MSYGTQLLLLQVPGLVFVAAFGACVGSLINVVAYRMPLGLSIVTPPSRCPACDTRLTWRENIPVLGWLLLRGRCRFCRSRISPEYPIVEAAVALLFAGLYVLYYMIPARSVALGIDWGLAKPEWARAGLVETWPLFTVHLALVASLVAMTLIDARTFTIPLPLPWFASAAALVGHVGHAAWLNAAGRELSAVAAGWRWAIPTPGWEGIGVGLGGVAGLGVGLLLLRLGLVRRSFADYDEWEAGVRVAEARGAGDGDATSGPPGSGLPAETGATPPGGAADTAPPTVLWLQYPHARREMVKELAFLAPCVLLAIAGAWLARRWAVGEWGDGGGSVAWERLTAPPLWLEVLGGVLLGYLVGGGLVWGVRILGSLAFGREAMGLGDVHLMGAVGAALGWIDPVLAFFAAAFVAVGWYTFGLVLGGRGARAMPFGPHLAAGTVLVMVFKPVIEYGMMHLLQVPEGAPPINIP